MKAMENKTVLVTGATGLVGSNLVERLIAMENVKVIAMGRSERKIKEIFKQYINKSNFKYYIQDVTEKFNLISEQVDYIFHAASPIAGSIIKSKPLDVINSNLIGLENCLSFMRQQKGYGRLVVFSSATVYGNCTDKEQILDENDCYRTEVLDSITAPYSESKRMVEVIALAYKRQYDLDVVIARLSYVYGPSYFRPETAFYEFISKAIQREDIIINNPDIPRRDNIYVDDAVQGLLQIACVGVSGEAYNVSSAGMLENYIAVDEMAKKIVDIVNFEKIYTSKIIYNNDTRTRSPGIKLDNSKLRNLGWSVKCSMEEGISKTVEYYLKRWENDFKTR